MKMIGEQDKWFLSGKVECRNACAEARNFPNKPRMQRVEVICAIAVVMLGA